MEEKGPVKKVKMVISNNVAGTLSHIVPEEVYDWLLEEIVKEMNSSVEITKETGEKVEHMITNRLRNELRKKITEVILNVCTCPPEYGEQDCATFHVPGDIHVYCHYCDKPLALYCFDCEFFSSTGAVGTLDNIKCSQHREYIPQHNSKPCEKFKGRGTKQSDVKEPEEKGMTAGEIGRDIHG